MSKISAFTTAVAAGLLSFSVIADSAQAAAFTGGNIVVSRVAGTTSTLAEVFIDEYTTAGSLAQSLGLPTTNSAAAGALTLTGTATSAGFLTRSTDGRNLTIFGYNYAPGTATGGNPNRTVAFIDYNGVVDTTTRTSQTGATPRSAAAINDSGVWIASDTGSGSTGGTRFLAKGANGVGTLITDAAFNMNNRVVNIFNGQLYVSASVGNTNGVSVRGVNKIGTGTPNTAGQPVTPTVGGALGASGNADSTYDFFFADANTAYLADDSATARGIQKWSFNGSAWVKLWNVTPDSTTGVRGLTGAVDALGNVILYGVTAVGSGQNAVVSLSDTLAGTTAPAASAYVTVATAPAGSVFRGVEFAPVPEPTTFAAVGGLVSLLLRRRRD